MRVNQSTSRCSSSSSGITITFFISPHSDRQDELSGFESYRWGCPSASSPAPPPSAPAHPAASPAHSSPRGCPPLGCTDPTAPVAMGRTRSSKPGFEVSEGPVELPPGSYLALDERKAVTRGRRAGRSRAFRWFGFGFGFSGRGRSFPVERVLFADSLQWEDVEVNRQNCGI